MIEDNRSAATGGRASCSPGPRPRTVERNTVSDNEVGISLFDRSNANVVRRNSAAMNVTGIALTFGGTGNRIEHNSVSASKGAAIRLAETGSATWCPATS